MLLLVSYLNTVLTSFIMVSTVVLAGGKAKEKPRDFLRRKWIEVRYGEHYLWGEYKPLKQVSMENGHGLEKAPLVHFVLDNASKAESIDDIVIVGETERLQASLADRDYGKPIRFVQQVGSISENALEGYANTEAAGKGEHALFVPCDIPRVTPDMYDSFVGDCQEIEDSFDLIYAVIGKESITKQSYLVARLYYSIRNRINIMTGQEPVPKSKRLYFRPYFWCVDDEFMPDYQEARHQNIGNSMADMLVNLFGVGTMNRDLIHVSRTLRRGFRMGNVGYGNPTGIEHVERVDNVYSARKLLDPYNVAFAVSEGGFRQFIDYFRGRLTVSDINRTACKYLGTRATVLEITFPEMENDVDTLEDIDMLAQ